MEKIDRFFSYLVVLALGIGLGVYWRMAQVEPGIDSQIKTLEKEISQLEAYNNVRREIRGSIISLETRIKNLEKKMRVH